MTNHVCACMVNVSGQGAALSEGAYIALEQQHTPLKSLATARFCSLQLDGSTKSGNVEVESVIHSRHICTCIHNDVGWPGRANAQGLLVCLQAGMDVGVANLESSVNMGTTGGLKGLMTETMANTLQGTYIYSIYTTIYHVIHTPRQQYYLIGVKREFRRVSHLHEVCF